MRLSAKCLFAATATILACTSEGDTIDSTPTLNSNSTMDANDSSGSTGPLDSTTAAPDSTDSNTAGTEGTNTSTESDTGQGTTGDDNNTLANFVSSGKDNSCAVLMDGQIKCWGENRYGQLGQGKTASIGTQPGQLGEALAPISLGPESANSISISDHTCVLLGNSTIKCWGNNSDGQLGRGHTENIGDMPGEVDEGLSIVPVGNPYTVQSIAVGGSHSCAVLGNGAVQCWGRNAHGQLGQGHTESIGDNLNEMGDFLPPVDLGENLVASMVSAGSNHTCALLTNGSIKCWGHNNIGQLGIGSTDNVGDHLEEMGDNLPIVPLGLGRTAVQITSGYTHTCALLDDHSVKCWGGNANGQLGQGHTDNVGDLPNELGQNLPKVELGTNLNAISISASGEHSCAILSDNSLKCWGNNRLGRLGQGHAFNIGDMPGQMGDKLFPIDLGSGRTAVQVAAGSEHTCALLDNGRIKCWGFNLSGQLGQGHSENLGDSINEMGEDLLPIEL